MKFLRLWFPVVCYAGLIFYVSSLPNLKTGAVWPHFDKLAHFIEYSPFGFLVARAIFWTKNQNLSRKALIICATLIVFLYGLSDEYHQSFVAGRESGLADAIFDMLGGLAGSFIYTFLINKKARD